MTWTAHCTVEDVGNGPAPIDVLLAANAGDRVKPHPDGPECDAISSNTEGKIGSVEVRLQLDQDATTLQIGDFVTVSGHFQGVPATG